MPSDVAILFAVPSGKIVSGGPFAFGAVYDFGNSAIASCDDDKVGRLLQRLLQLVSLRRKSTHTVSCLLEKLADC